jgi:hypothetical protein
LVVLVSLFTLGVFDTNTFSPKAAPGSCQVYKPEGPWSSSLATLTGLCNNQPPQFMAIFSPSSKSNGQVSYEAPLVPNSITVSAWVNPSAINIAGQGIFGNLNSYYLSLNGAGQLTWDLVTGSGDNSFASKNSLVAGKFEFVSATYDGSYARTYINGVMESSSVQTGLLGSTTTPFFIGNTLTYFSGGISNVQVYNTSFSPGDEQSLYVEGIGGPPLILRNLVGWWPLNSNMNDYSGNNVTSLTNGIGYTNVWSGYSPP